MTSSRAKVPAVLVQRFFLAGPVGRFFERSLSVISRLASERMDPRCAPGFLPPLSPCFGVESVGFFFLMPTRVQGACINRSRRQGRLPRQVGCMLASARF
jgi:hypothetical protein